MFVEIKAMLLDLWPSEEQPAFHPSASPPEALPPVLSPEVLEDNVLSTRAPEGLGIADEWKEEQVDVVRGSVTSRTSAAKPAVKVALVWLGLDIADIETAWQSRGPFFDRPLPLRAAYSREAKRSVQIYLPS